jgi:hypothetical protein
MVTTARRDAPPLSARQFGGPLGHDARRSWGRYRRWNSGEPRRSPARVAAGACADSIAARVAGERSSRGASDAMSTFAALKPFTARPNAKFRRLSSAARRTRSDGTSATAGICINGRNANPTPFGRHVGHCGHRWPLITRQLSTCYTRIPAIEHASMPSRDSSRWSRVRGSTGSDPVASGFDTTSSGRRCTRKPAVGVEKRRTDGDGLVNVDE